MVHWGSKQVFAGVFILITACCSAVAQTSGDAIGEIIKDIAIPRPKPKAPAASIAASKLFAAEKVAAKLRPASYGFYTRGCLAGAELLEETGPAWQVMRLSRNRNWGHPELVGLIRKLAREVREHDGWPGLLIGDISQPRGGPMLSGHLSHQIGLDADIWFNRMPDRTMNYDDREKISAKSMVLDRKRLNRKRWTENHAKVLYRAANYPEVERILVHPPIKKEMCDWATRKKIKNRDWLAKIRAYYGHHYHFHLRIRCPKGLKGCRNQTPPPRHDDCKTNLAYWMGEGPWKKPKKPKGEMKKKQKLKVVELSDLPTVCKKVLLAD